MTESSPPPRIRRLGLLLLLVASVVWAGVGYVDFLKALGQRESSMLPGAINYAGYVGLFQFGEAALQDVGLYAGDSSPRQNDWSGTFTGKYGVTSLADFLADPDAQLQAVTAYHARLWKTLADTYGAGEYIGREVGGVEITESGLVAAAHLLGPATVGKWLASGGASDPSDANGTTLTSYLSSFAGYALSASAPTYTSLLAAVPSGGAASSGYSYTPPPLSPSGNGGSTAMLSSTNSHGFGSAADGFHASTGYDMGQVRTLFVGLVAMTVLTWMAYVVMSKWRSYSHGGESARNMTFDVLRAMVVTTVVLLLMV